MTQARDHGGGLDAAVARFGGTRAAWLDLSTGINPEPYPVGDLSAQAWCALPDSGLVDRLIAAARTVWAVPDGAAVLPVPGASAAIAQIPFLATPDTVHIPSPTYNEHAASFAAAGWALTPITPAAAQVLVHPNNPDGIVWSAGDVTAALAVIDESFADVMPTRSLIDLSARRGVIVLKSFGKFWGLAGLRLGFAIGDPDLIGALAARLGPWPVSGVALELGACALEDLDWGNATRARLAADTARLDALMVQHGARLRGGTDLFRLYTVDDATAWQNRLAEGRVWSRTFPYASDWLRLGLPPADRWQQVEQAL